MWRRKLRNGIKIIDMDTHIQPSQDILEKYVEPSFRSRLPEFDPYRTITTSSRGPGGQQTVSDARLNVASIPYDRFPGTAPKPEDDVAVAGGRGALEGRVVSQYRAPVQPGVQNENAAGRLIDMDLEGRDVDFIFPGSWASTLTGIYDKDVTLPEGLYRAYHYYMRDYCSVAPDRLRASLQVPASDPEWAVSEIKTFANEKWVSAVWMHLPVGLPVDHPDLDPIFATLNELDLPLVHHSFFMEPPYFPGYKDIWGNTVVARTAAHPWGAARLCAYLIPSGLFDRYPNLRAGVSEVGHGWLTNWVIRLGFNKSYVQGVTPDLKCTPLEYCQMGRFRCAAEPFEGPAMTKACVEILGEDCLMHQSDYPHGQAWFPETAKEVIDWDFWPTFGKDALQKHMYDNAAKFLRMI